MRCVCGRVLLQLLATTCATRSPLVPEHGRAIASLYSGCLGAIRSPRTHRTSPHPPDTSMYRASCALISQRSAEARWRCNLCIPGLARSVRSLVTIYPAFLRMYDRSMWGMCTCRSRATGVARPQLSPDSQRAHRRPARRSSDVLQAKPAGHRLHSAFPECYWTALEKGRVWWTGSASSTCLRSS